MTPHSDGLVSDRTAVKTNMLSSSRLCTCRCAGCENVNIACGHVSLHDGAQHALIWSFDTVFVNVLRAFPVRRDFPRWRSPSEDCSSGAAAGWRRRPGSNGSTADLLPVTEPTDALGAIDWAPFISRPDMCTDPTKWIRDLIPRIWIRDHRRFIRLASTLC